MPLRHRHGYAAVFSHGLYTDSNNRIKSRPCRRASLAQPLSTRFELMVVLRSVMALVSLVHLPVLLAGPDRSGSTRSSRRCQGCSHPPLRLQVRTALSFTQSTAIACG